MQTWLKRLLLRNAGIVVMLPVIFAFVKLLFLLIAGVIIFGFYGTIYLWICASDCLVIACFIAYAWLLVK
jgi:hypothetical protein